ncbi:MAG TPA: hypothetical protein DEH25_11400, partial [Chloroflexi bacterium]|nr:hypothetical protein [Chloroflexota bacterium]
EPGSITIPLMRQYVDDFVLVSEVEIRQAMIFAWQRYAERIEGAAAAALAAVLSGKVAAPAVVIISGGNVQPQTHAQVIAGEAT